MRIQIIYRTTKWFPSQKLLTDTFHITFSNLKNKERIVKFAYYWLRTTVVFKKINIIPKSFYYVKYINIWKEKGLRLSDDCRYFKYCLLWVTWLSLESPPRSSPLIQPDINWSRTRRRKALMMITDQQTHASDLSNSIIQTLGAAHLCVIVLVTTLGMASAVVPDAQSPPGLVSPVEIYRDYISKSSGWSWVIVEKTDTCVRNKPIRMSRLQHFSIVPNKQCCHAEQDATQRTTNSASSLTIDDFKWFCPTKYSRVILYLWGQWRFSSLSSSPTVSHFFSSSLSVRQFSADSRVWHFVAT